MCIDGRRRGMPGQDFFSGDTKTCFARDAKKVVVNAEINRAVVLAFGIVSCRCFWRVRGCSFSIVNGGSLRCRHSCSAVVCVWRVWRRVRYSQKISCFWADPKFSWKLFSLSIEILSKFLFRSWEAEKIVRQKFHTNLQNANHCTSGGKLRGPANQSVFCLFKQSICAVPCSGKCVRRFLAGLFFIRFSHALERCVRKTNSVRAQGKIEANANRELRVRSKKGALKKGGTMATQDVECNSAS